MLKRTTQTLILMVMALVMMGAAKPKAKDVDDDDEVTPTSYETPLSASFELQYIPRIYSNYQFAPGVVGGGPGYGGNLQFEWIPYNDYGKACIGIGVGFFLQPDRAIDGTSAAATLYTYPIELTLAYRADFFQRQIVVPYGKIGPSLTIGLQNSGTAGYGKNPPPFIGLNVGGGLEICISCIDRTAAKSMDMNFGVNGTYLMAEYVSLSGLGSADANNDFSHSEFRFGLRFEM